MAKMRLRKRRRGKRGGRRGRVPKKLSTKVKRIYDTDGNLIMVGTEAEWRHSAQRREMERRRAAKKLLRKIRQKKVRPLLHL